MAITTKEQALIAMKAREGITLQDIIDYFVSRGLGTESEIKQRIKDSYPDVTDWGF